MVDAFVGAVAAALTQQAVEGVAEVGAWAWSRLVRLVRDKFGRDPRASAALESARQAPEDQSRHQVLASALWQAMADDPEFAAELRSLWQQARVAVRAGDAGVASQFSGTGDRLVQAARDVNIWHVPSATAAGGPGSAGVPPRPPAPRQVPPSPATFVNRLAELSALDEVLVGDRPAGARLGVLVGMPGVGKTALARRWAQSARGRFPGGELYVDYASLYGRGGAGAAVTEAVASCLRGLGVHERFLPATLADLTSLFRSRTAEAPALLVVLDGVSEPGQVLPLIPNAPGSAVVVTADEELGELVLDGARMVAVRTLDETAGIELLAAACGAARVAADRSAATRLVELCGGLPVALRVAAARLALDPTLEVAELADELADESRLWDALSLPSGAAAGSDGTVAALFTSAYRRLPDQAQALYRDLGAVPVTELAEDLVAAVAGVDRVGVGAPLGRLVAAGLLERVAPGRYRQHHLVRQHAARLAGGDPRRCRQVGDRVIRFHLDRARWADRAVMGDRLRIGGTGRADEAGSGGGTGPAVTVEDDQFTGDPFPGPDRRATALAWLARERANLLAVLRFAAGAGHDDAVWQLAEALTALYLNHRHHADWIEATRLGVEAAVRCGRYDAQARLHSLVSRAHTDLGDLDQAGVEIEAALAAAGRVDRPVLLASVWEFRGRYLDHVDRARAVEAYQRSIELNETAGERRGAALGRYFLGCCLDGDGRTAEALPILTRARADLSELGDERMAARASASLGLAYHHLGEDARAGQELRAALEVFVAGQLWHYEVPARETLAEVAAGDGDLAMAREHLQRALWIEEAVGGARSPKLRARLAALADRQP